MESLKPSVVPSLLPQILKDFSREVIQTQPDNIFEFARKYFIELAERQLKLQSQDKGEACLCETITKDKLIALRDKVGSAISAPATADEITNFSQQCQLSGAIIEKLLGFLEEEGVTQWDQMLVMATTLVTSSLTEIFHLIFALFGAYNGNSSEDIFMESKYLSDLFHYLAARYDGITEKVGNSISEYMLSKSFVQKIITEREFFESSVIHELSQIEKNNIH
jgi:hypothetical protein